MKFLKVMFLSLFLCNTVLSADNQDGYDQVDDQDQQTWSEYFSSKGKSCAITTAKGLRKLAPLAPLIASTVMMTYAIEGAEAFPPHVCAPACAVLHKLGCGAGAAILGSMNPGVGVCYLAICDVTEPSSVASCMTVCSAI